MGLWGVGLLGVQLRETAEGCSPEPERDARSVRERQGLAIGTADCLGRSGFLMFYGPCALTVNRMNLRIQAGPIIVPVSVRGW